MTLVQRLTALLTPLDVVFAELLRGLQPSPAVELPLSEAVGSIAAELPWLKAYPPYNIAATDGWALSARDLVGVSPIHRCRCTRPGTGSKRAIRYPTAATVIDLDSVDQTGASFQVLTEAIPGQRMRRTGSDFGEGFCVQPGSPVRPRDVLVARSAGLDRIKVRRPRMRLVNVPSTRREIGTAQLIRESARCVGAEVVFTEVPFRDAASIAEALGAAACDLIVTIGGSGVGRTDTTIVALAQCGEVIAHGIALRPGTTSAIARIGNTPVIVVSGLADHALAAWWTLAPTLS
jgi:molybdopterin molybdotransferase